MFSPKREIGQARQGNRVDKRIISIGGIFTGSDERRIRTT